MRLPQLVVALAALLALAVPVRGYDWQFEQVDKVGNWSSPSLKLSGTGVLHFCYRAPGNLVVHSYLDSAWHHEEVGPFDTLAGYSMDAGPHGEFGVLVNLTGGNIRLYEKQDTSWLEDSLPVPANTSRPFFGYDTTGAASAVFLLPDGRHVMFAKRADSTWASETVAVGPAASEFLPSAFVYTVDAEPCVMVFELTYDMVKLVFLYIEQGDSWTEYLAVNGGERSLFNLLGCAPDTGGGAAVLYDYRGQFPPYEFCYKGFGAGRAVLDSWADAVVVAVHRSGTPHVAYREGQLRYACRVGATWDSDTISPAFGLLLAGIVLEDSLPVVGFIDPATGVWLARRQPVGIQEQQQCRLARTEPTIVRGVLRLPVATNRRLPRVGQLYDLNGRLVAHLHPGPNDVRALAPGVYFVRGEGRGEGRGTGDEGRIRKVVVTR